MNLDKLLEVLGKSGAPGLLLLVVGLLILVYLFYTGKIRSNISVEDEERKRLADAQALAKAFFAEERESRQQEFSRYEQILLNAIGNGCGKYVTMTIEELTQLLRAHENQMREEFDAVIRLVRGRESGTRPLDSTPLPVNRNE